MVWVNSLKIFHQNDFLNPVSRLFCQEVIKVNLRCSFSQFLLSFWRNFPQIRALNKKNLTSRPTSAESAFGPENCANIPSGSILLWLFESIVSEKLHSSLQLCCLSPLFSKNWKTKKKWALQIFSILGTILEIFEKF